jgi:hypothetical protein
MSDGVKDQRLVALVLAKFPGAEIVDVRLLDLGLEAPRVDPDTGAKSFSLGVLQKLAIAEADRVEAVQELLVKNGDRSTPDQRQLNKAEGWRAIASLVERCSDPIIKERLRSMRA